MASPVPASHEGDWNTIKQKLQLLNINNLLVGGKEAYTWNTNEDLEGCVAEFSAITKATMSPITYPEWQGSKKKKKNALFGKIANVLRVQ